MRQRSAERSFVVGVAAGALGSFLTILAVTLDVNRDYGPIAVPFLIGAAAVPPLVAPRILRLLPASLSSRTLLLRLQITLAAFVWVVASLYQLASWMPFVLVAGVASAKSIADPSLQSLIGRRWESDSRRLIFARLQTISAIIGAVSPLLGAGLREIWGTPWVLVVDGFSYLIAASIFSRVFRPELTRDIPMDDSDTAEDVDPEPATGSRRWLVTPAIALLFGGFVIGFWIDVTEYAGFDILNLTDRQIIAWLTAWAVGSFLTLFVVTRTGAEARILPLIVLVVVALSAYPVLPLALSLIAFAVAGFGVSFINAVARPAAQDDVGALSDRGQALFWARFGRVQAVVSVGSIVVAALLIDFLSFTGEVLAFGIIFVACGAALVSVRVWQPRSGAPADAIGSEAPRS